MGLSRCAIYVSGTDVDDLVRVCESLEIVKAGSRPLRTASDQSDIGDGEVGLAERNGWGVIFADSGPFLDGKAIESLPSVSVNRKVFMWLTQSTSGGLWFEYHENGHTLRKWLEVESQVEESVGAPIAGEPDGFFTEVPDDEGARDENALLELSAHVTGISEDDLFEMSFVVHAGYS